MAVLRIVTNMATADPAGAAAFYRDLLGLTVPMDQGWIVTLAAGRQAAPQISFISEHGAGAGVPDITIEVDDLEFVLDRARKAALVPEYGPVREAWGVSRFFLRDPSGRLLNIMMHDVEAS